MTPSYGNLFRVFGRIGLLSFGGPAAQIALMEDELVTRKNWLTQDAFLRALSFCMLLPGPEAMQLATYAGWRLRGTLGGVLAGLLFVLPGALVIFALAILYLQYGSLPIVQAAFLGVQATVITIVVQALHRLSGKALKGGLAWALALGSFLAVFLLGTPFPLILLVAALIGAWRFGSDPVQPAEPVPTKPTHPVALALWALAWMAPIVLLWMMNAPFLTDIALFFSRLAIVTFGGAYAVLAYMTQQVVGDFGWLTTEQMIDALGLAETTPGPLILVTQFVGTIAGAAEGGLAYGVLAGAITLWVTFVPCFLWIFAGAPYLERLTAAPRLAGALKAITAAVVGVILNLSLWFALHVVFKTVESVSFGIAAIPVPDVTGLNPMALGLIGLSAALLLWRSLPMPLVLAMAAIASIVLHSAMGLLAAT
ncbi:chromate efflux transporter [Shimia ponticola]|uniref:chromate efflux transporter n=1 Tax=Shimia ponticola TaxID=2582893 RepID=UPI0011BDB70C|nr:chromate efflux transporter [Shimia ponticola]